MAACPQPVHTRAGAPKQSPPHTPVHRGPTQQQAPTLLAVCVMMHLPSQDALLIGGHRWVLDQLEEGVARLAGLGGRPGLLWPGCVVFVPGHREPGCWGADSAEATRRRMPPQRPHPLSCWEPHPGYPKRVLEKPTNQFLSFPLPPPSRFLHVSPGSLESL